MKVKVQTEVEAPEGATHYFGNLLDEPIFAKCTQVGVVGDHWWQWSSADGEWKFLSHHKPHWMYPILEVNSVSSD